MAKTFDALAGRPKGVKGCANCGEATAGVVFVQLREYGSPGNLKNGRTVASRSRSYCEPCAVRKYESLLLDLEAVDR